MSIDTIRETIDEIQEIKWLIDDGPAHPKLTEAQTRLTNIKSTLSTYADEIRRECADKATAWLAELHGEVPDPTLPWSSKLMWVRALQVSTLTAAIMGKEET